MTLSFTTKLCQFNFSKLIFKQFLYPKHAIRVCPCVTRVTFWEADRKKINKDISKKELIMDGLKSLRGEVKLFKKEMKEQLQGDILLRLEHGDYEYLWKFNDRETIENWIVTSDQDNSEGTSEANLQLNKNNNGIFHGTLNTTVLKDGINKRAGYCNIKSPPNMISFKRTLPYNFQPFNCLVMRVRGDGRNYIINIGMERYFDVMWDDQYTFALFTRGGPYWQTVKIPFSKFLLTFKGRIQDKQSPIETNRVSFLGITQADGNAGPFALEIDYIALLYDANHKEKFAYEMYEVDPAHVGS